MSKPDDGGPAFPLSRGHFTSDGRMLSVDWLPGMSLRDWFAGQAIVGITTHAAVQGGSRDLGALAYEVADATIAERQKGGS